MFGFTRVVLPSLLLVTFESPFTSLAVEPAVGGAGSTTQAPDHTPGGRAQPSEWTDDVLATVNGMPIVAADVDFASRGSHDIDAVPRRRNEVLEGIIEQELARQKAVELGLDADPGFQARLRQMEAQLNAFRRKELSELYFRHETARHAEVSDTEAQQYFAENAARIRSQFHILQILEREEDRVEQALTDIRQGASFEEVARRRFPNLPKTAGEPWDLGYLRWMQLPKSWRSVVDDLKPGEVSDVIRGPNRRFWILKLIDKREDPQMTFESVKPIIVRDLKNSKIEELRDATHRDLRARANIVYADSTPGAEETAGVRSAPHQSETPSE